MAGLSHEENLDAIRFDANNAGERKRLENIRLAGQQTSRERIMNILDEKTFVEVDAFVNHRSAINNLQHHRPLGDGVVAGHGMIDGRRVVCFSQDSSVFEGSIGEMHARKIVKILEFAEKTLLPVIAIWDGNGERPEEGISSLGPSGEILNVMVACSGRIPLISIIMGKVTGVSALAVGLSDFVIMNSINGNMALSDEIDRSDFNLKEEIKDFSKNATNHFSRSGVVCLIAEDDTSALELASDLLSYFPDNMLSKSPVLKNDDIWDRNCNEINKILPYRQEKTYDVREIIKIIFDKKTFLELFSDYASNIVVGLARLDGISIGIVANQSSVLEGSLDIKSSIKAARFIRTCDCFNIPIVTLIDSPGFLPEITQEFGGIINHGAKLPFAYSEATVPKLSVVIGKAYGGAYLAMGCKQLNSDYNISWPSGEITVMESKDAVNIIHSEELSNSENHHEIYKKLLNNYKEKFDDPYAAAKKGWIDDVVEPEMTRRNLIKALRPLLSKKEWSPSKKHGNIPL
ncbi:MAG: acyl-CoA carboxylase subunit beta [Candidatus Thalassarchaeaceae archaeon]|tara:strand:+ start:21481 stop:23031 length:1551 start_codon:yes stop_codon:yes gene_type:complete